MCQEFARLCFATSRAVLYTVYPCVDACLAHTVRGFVQGPSMTPPSKGVMGTQASGANSRSAKQWKKLKAPKMDSWHTSVALHASKRTNAEFKLPSNPLWDKWLLRSLENFPSPHSCTAVVLCSAAKLYRHTWTTSHRNPRHRDKFWVCSRTGAKSKSLSANEKLEGKGGVAG